MMGTKDQVRVSLCSDMLSSYDSYFSSKLGTDSILAQELLDFCSNRPEVDARHVLLYLMYSVDSIGYDKSYYYLDLVNLLDTLAQTYGYKTFSEYCNEIDSSGVDCGNICKINKQSYLSSLILFLQGNSVDLKSTIINLVQERL